MFKYILTFSKTGTICYISHLDMMKLFKRCFKRAGIKLSYSQGFHPHPKMGFAQALSLGYWGMNELFEFETDEEYAEDSLRQTLQDMMPEGLSLISCRKADASKKTLAARTEAAEYIIAIPLAAPLDMTGQEIKAHYMGQEKIIAWKKQKKKKDLTEVDIRPMIRGIDFVPEAEALFVTALLDAGSASNLSPELVIGTLMECLDLDVERSAVSVMRREIIYK